MTKKVKILKQVPSKNSKLLQNAQEVEVFQIRIVRTILLKNTYTAALVYFCPGRPFFDLFCLDYIRSYQNIFYRTYFYSCREI